jgi:hypothetical protein
MLPDLRQLRAGIEMDECLPACSAISIAFAVIRLTPVFLLPDPGLAPPQFLE